MGVALPAMLPPPEAMEVDGAPEEEQAEEAEEAEEDEEEEEVMLATQGFDTQPADDSEAAGDAGMTEAEMLAAIFDRFDADADGLLSRSEATAWGKAVADGREMDDGTYRSLVQASLPPGESQQHDNADAVFWRGIDLPGLTRVYMMCETDLDIAASYEAVVRSVPVPRNLNLKFYRNRCECSAGVSIEEFFRTWTGDYERLEQAHNYIQWLFPSPEASMFNYSSQPLTQHEAEVMRRDSSIQRRLKRSVALFLDFLGLQIDFDAPPTESAVARGKDAPARLMNAESNPHNFLRISRLVRCMGEVGLQQWQRPLLAQLATEVFQTGALRSAADSYCKHWLAHVSSADDREALQALIPGGDGAAEEEMVGQVHDGTSSPGEQAKETSVRVATYEHARQQEDEPSRAAAGAEPAGPLFGSTIFVDPESYSQYELQDLRTELQTNGAVVLASIARDSLSACTHVLCECEHTRAFALVEQQPEDSDVLCVNARWLRACIRRNRLLGVDRDCDTHLRFLPHRAARIGSDQSRNLYPSSYKDYWDDQHVKLPCSPQNCLGEVFCKWSLIHYYLSQPMPDLASLEASLRHIHVFRKHDFTVLRKAVSGFAEADEFFVSALPMMTRLCLEMPQLFAVKGVPMLESSKDSFWTVTQREACCLLAAAFFCLFPDRHGNALHRQDLPSINFSSLFERGGPTSWGADTTKAKAAKLRCLLHYFCRAARAMPNGKLTYHRRAVDTDINWLEVTMPIVPVRVVKSGLIEDADGCLQVDFANEFVGGGVLGHGAVQEEIRFAICPELIVSRLFTPRLQANEVLIVYGVERFCTYSGYTSSFQCTGDFVDDTLRDESGHRQTVVAAMDALDFSSGAAKQYGLQYCEREAGKAWAAFSCADVPGGAASPPVFDLMEHLDEEGKHSQRMPVASGNWGCGVFGGDRFLKALLQALAATAADRPRLDYYTVADGQLTEQLQHLFEQIAERSMTVGEVWEILGKYRREAASNGMRSFEAFLIQAGFLPDPEVVGTEEDEGETQHLRGGSEKASEPQQPLKQSQQTLDSLLPKHAARAGQLERAARGSSGSDRVCGKDGTSAATTAEQRPETQGERGWRPRGGHRKQHDPAQREADRGRARDDDANRAPGSDKQDGTTTVREKRLRRR